MSAKYYKSILKDGVFVDTIPAIDGNGNAEEGYIPKEEIQENRDITAEEFIEEVEKQKKVFRTYLLNKKALIDSHKGKVIPDELIDIRIHSPFLDIQEFKILELKPELDIESLDNTGSLSDFELDKDTTYLGDIYLNADVNSEYGYDLEVYDISYRILTVRYREPLKCWFDDKAIMLAIYNKITTHFKTYGSFTDAFDMLVNGELTMKGFIRKLSLKEDEDNVSC